MVYALINVAILAAIIGCSTSNPISPNASLETELRNSQNSSNRAIISIGTISISEDRSSVELLPDRSSDLHLNVVKLLEGKACDNCLTIEDFAVTSQGILHCNVTLTHPFPGLKQYTGFDVRAIVVTNSDYTFPLSGRSVSRNGDHLKMVYADGYTNVFNPTEFPSDPDVQAALRYIKGKKSVGDDLSATLNPYIVYMRDSERRHFPAGQAETNKFMFQLPSGPIEFGYIVDVCWTPVSGQVNNPVEDFPQEANCLEAYQTFTRQGAGLTDDVGSEAMVQVEIWDHQGIDTISTVLLEAPDLFNGLVELSLSNTMDERIIFEGTIQNELGAGLGEYPVLTRVIDTEADPNLGQIDAWNVTEFKVTESGYPLNDLILIEKGEFFMGRDPNNYTETLLGMADPGHMHPTGSYYISKYEITCREFSSFIAAGGYDNPEWWSDDGWALRISLDLDKPFSWGKSTQGDHSPEFPVGLSYYEAEAFCNWVGGRLPTEPEWERAARGEDHRLYPWGNEWDPSKCAMMDNPMYPIFRHKKSGMCPVGTFSPEGDSPYGLADCSGNVVEFTSYWAYEFDEMEFYIYEQWASGNFDPIPGPNEDYQPRNITRGGGPAGFEESWLTFSRSANRVDIIGTYKGFRVVFEIDG
jgi:formylglycine-generating enzyme required for sulfatase activity